MRELIHRLLSLPVVLCCAMCASPPDESVPLEKRTECGLVFRIPVLESEKISSIVLGVDHDPEDRDLFDCLSYDGLSFPHCYDGHNGTDFTLYGGFDAMDSGSAVVVAAAEGTVIGVIDGYYDRCHFNLSSFTEPDCDGHVVQDNRVTIEHKNGVVSLYGHFMKNSIGVVEGEWVETGDYLGLIGSSGASSTPHLHFEVRNKNNVPFDPYSGPFSQTKSWWCDQGETDGFPGECL